MSNAILDSTFIIYSIYPESCPGPDLEWCFRVEIFKSLDRDGVYFPVVWLKEDFRIQFTSPLKDGKSESEASDVMLLYEEESWGWDEIEGHDPQEVLKKVKLKISERFGKVVP